MIVKEIKYKSIKIRFNKPFKSFSHILYEKSGFYLVITDQYGNKGIGEASPLPGFSKENISEAEQDINYLTKLFSRKEFHLSNALINDISYDKKIVPSVCFAFEQALFNLALLQNERTNNLTAGLIGKSFVEVNSIIDIDEKSEVLNRIEADLLSGYKTIKLKVGRLNFDEDLQIIDLVRNRIPEKINLRLDANGAWDIDTAYERIQKLSPYNIQYIEDPCKYTDCMVKLSRVSPIPVAIDLTINSIDCLREHIINGTFKYIIVKPMILGSIFKLIELIKLAESRNVNLIVSSAFETAVGRSILFYLAALTNHNFAHGLATSGYLQNDNMYDPFQIINGETRVDKIIFPPTFDIGL
ncbi:MAG: o-succinylbenzoate synthase [Bacteroidota bacterium]